MAGDWILLPPLGDEHYPPVAHGSRIRDDFDVVEHTSEYEILTCFHWAGLSRQEISHVRNLAHSNSLSELLRPYGYGISSGSQLDHMAEKDPNDAEFDLMISSREAIPPALLGDIVDFVKRYTVS